VKDFLSKNPVERMTKPSSVFMHQICRGASFHFLMAAKQAYFEMI